MINYNEVDAANRIADQQDDEFKLDSLEPSKEESTERQAEFTQICVYLNKVGMDVMDIVKVSAKLMDSWKERNDAYYYELGTHNTYLLYKGYCISYQSGQWLFVFEDNEKELFFDVDLMMGLRVIDNAGAKS